MPTYDITHKCGCTVEKTVCGTTRERSNKVELDFLIGLGVEEKETYEKGVIVETIKHYEGKYNGSKKEEHASCVE